MQSFRFVLFTVFELQGSKLKNKKKKKKKQKKNWENELFVISPLLKYVAHSYHSAVTELNSQK